MTAFEALALLTADTKRIYAVSDNGSVRHSAYEVHADGRIFARYGEVTTAQVNGKRIEFSV